MINCYNSVFVVSERHCSFVWSVGDLFFSLMFAMAILTFVKINVDILLIA